MREINWYRNKDSGKGTLLERNGRGGAYRHREAKRESARVRNRACTAHDNEILYFSRERVQLIKFCTSGVLDS